MKKLLSVLAVSTQLIACGSAVVDDSAAAADSVAQQESAISATNCQVNLPTRVVATSRATKMYASPNATSAVVLDLPVGHTVELETTNFENWRACPTNGFFAVLDVKGNYDFGYVKAVDLVLAGWAPDGISNPQYPLTITANTQANAASDFLTDSTDEDYWRVPTGDTGVNIKSPPGRNYNIQLVRWNSVDGTVTVLQESTQTTTGGIDSLAVTATDRTVRIVSADGYYGIGPGNNYKIWTY
ncbi:hypothetical protein [Archangium lipolyticum]|uniref:hypothetical protein n=1 Tax=Archangium lipolyticum TaxID=2970465 RepID=UPI00214A53F9|nr:hypothetical protein [Archangium lipolyticum]